MTNGEMNYEKIKTAAMAATWVCVAITSHATFMTVGSGPTNVTTGYAPQGFTFVTAADSGAGNSNLFVEVASYVIREDTSNPLGGLTFLYQVSVINGSLIQLGISGYTGSASKVNLADTTAASLGPLGQYFSPGGTAPASADWLGELEFNFASALNASDHSDILLVDTAATGYQHGYSFVNGIAFNILTDVPIPEPAALALASLGAAALVGVRSRRATNSRWCSAATRRANPIRKAGNNPRSSPPAKLTGREMSVCRSEPAPARWPQVTSESQT